MNKLSTNTPAARCASPCPQRLSFAASCVLQGVAGAAFAVTVAFGAAVPPAPTTFADLSLEQLMELKVERVYGASRHIQKVTNAPASVSILSADDIRQFGWRTLSDMLRSVRGFYTSDDRNYNYVGVRGFMRPGDFNTRILVLVDGHRTNDNIYDGGYIGREQLLAADLIERVEIIRGPSSSVYGSSAFLGVVNVVTRRPAETVSKLTTEVGNNRTFDTRLTFAHTFESGVEWLIAGTHYTSEGEDRLYYPEYDQRTSSEPAAANNGVAVDWDGERSAHVFSTLRYRDLTVTGYLSRRSKQVPTASYFTAFNDRTEQTWDRRGSVDVKLDRTVGDHRVQGRVFYDQYRYDGQYPFRFADAAGTPYVSRDLDRAVGEWVGTEWLLNARIAERHALTTGFEFRDNLRETQTAYYDGVLVTNHHTASRTLGIFAEWEAHLRKNLLLTAGVRHDHYFHNFGGTTNPRLALIYHLSEVATVKLLYGRAFRAPSPYECHYYVTQRLQRRLQPERIRTEELVFERYWGSSYRAHVSLYHYDVNDLISQRSTAAEALYFANVDRTHAHGVEVEAEAKYEGGLLVRASYAVQHAEDRVLRKRLTSSPRNLGKLNVGWMPTGQPFSAGLEVQYQSPSNTLAGNRTNDFVLANLHLLHARVLGDYECALTVTNLFDTKFAMPAAEEFAQDMLPQARRTVRLKVSKRF